MKLIKNVEIIEKKSKFYGFLFDCANFSDCQDILAELKKEHKKATHICYACRCDNPFFEKACDDGEPSGTAGRPILAVMQKRDCHNKVIFVVRFFGGIKLGAGGLVRVYTKVASELTKNE